MNKILLIIAVLAIATGCSIQQRVDPIQVTNNEELCIQKNPSVREGFLAEVEKILTEKQIKYRIVEQLDASQQCEWTATYTANWAWDLAIYMVYAEIKVFHNGKLDGEAIYDARMGGMNMNKFIDAEAKIRELIEQLIEQKHSSLHWSPLQQVAI